MTKRKSYITLLLLSCLYQFSSAQISIPITFHENKYILFRLSGLNGQDSLTFFFDTGASTTLLDKATAQKLGIKANIQRTVPGASGSKTYDVATGQKSTSKRILPLTTSILSWKTSPV